MVPIPLFQTLFGVQAMSETRFPAFISSGLRGEVLRTEKADAHIFSILLAQAGELPAWIKSTGK